MILRKPYAFFIKVFKPLHLLMAFLTIILLVLQNRILSFLNEYINTNLNTIGMNLVNTFGNNLLIIIPVILIILFIIILGIMIRKKKPSAFYVVSTFSLLAVIVINIYTFNFLKILEKNIVTIKAAKLIHDIVMINVIIEIIIVIILIIRGIGINIKKFDFDSDISDINITESDREEFELNINVDFDESRRKRKNIIRQLKYIYYENKFIYNCLIGLLSIIIIVTTIFLTVKKNRVNKENVMYQVNGFNYQVNKSMIVNTDFKGNKITDNYLLVVDTRLKAIYPHDLYIKDFSLIINNLIFKPLDNYNQYLLDLGSVYKNQDLSNELKDYLFVFEIPSNYIDKKMFFRYSNQGQNFDIKLTPEKIETKEEINTFNIGEELTLEELQDIKFTIDEYEIRDRFLVEYNYCIKKDDCVLSKEYLKGTLNTDFDKYVLRLKIKYDGTDKLNMNSFYSLLSKFGEIKYKIGDNWYSQNSDFEEIKSNKSNDKDNIYIGINSDIYNASEIKIVFNIRSKTKEYILKGEI